MLKLRRGTVSCADPLTVRIGEQLRPAWADRALVGEVLKGDEVIVNTEALDLELGSGGFDVVHANLTRGLGAEAGDRTEHVMKLNYTSLQHSVEPVEEGHETDWRPRRAIPVLVCFLHGQLAPAAWSVVQAAPGLKVGYVQTVGGALPGTLSRDVAAIRGSGLLCGHLTAGPCHGGEHEAISVTGALHAAAGSLGWDAVIAAPGPGILGSATRYGHGGMAALDSAHSALALGLPTAIAPRLSSADERPRHRGLSHHTEAVLRLLLAPVQVASPEGAASAEELAAGIPEPHRVASETVDLDGYAASGLPARTMGRGIDEDPDFFAAGLAGGSLLASLAAGKGS
ncbi:MAG: DUF3866 family protein [Solirubrobacterales bacterium]